MSGSAARSGGRPSDTRAPAGEETAGLAHVATVSFLASRATPPIGFFVALAGGVALARVGQLRGARWGYGASVAAMLQTVAIIGPVRFGVPLTQALTAPLLGVLEARGVGARVQMLVCAVIRLVQNALTSAFVIVVLTGLDVYLDSYDTIAGVIPLLPEGRAAAWIVTIGSLLVWAVFASVVQVWVYRRGLHGWPPAGEEHAAARRRAAGGRVRSRARRGGSTPAPSRWPPRSPSACWCRASRGCCWGRSRHGCVVAALASRGDRTVVPLGAGLALVLGTVIFSIAMLGGQGIEDSLARGSRAALLVLVATWLRAAAGTAGLREVSRRVLGRLRRVPAAAEAVLVMDELGSGRELGAAARSVLAALQGGAGADGPGARRGARLGRRRDARRSVPRSVETSAAAAHAGRTTSVLVALAAVASAGGAAGVPAVTRQALSVPARSSSAARRPCGSARNGCGRGAPWSRPRGGAACRGASSRASSASGARRPTTTRGSPR